MEAVEASELKSLVEAGNYKPDPAQIANAMLQRRGVRELLTGLDGAIDPAIRAAKRSGRTPRAPVIRPRAA